jgi:hypothetical protein
MMIRYLPPVAIVERSPPVVEEAAAAACLAGALGTGTGTIFGGGVTLGLLSLLGFSGLGAGGGGCTFTFTGFTVSALTGFGFSTFSGVGFSTFDALGAGGAGAGLGAGGAGLDAGAGTGASVTPISFASKSSMANRAVAVLALLLGRGTTKPAAVHATKANTTD